MKMRLLSFMKTGLSAILRYTVRHFYRSLVQTVLILFLVTLLTGTVGQLATLRARYEGLVSSVEIDVRFFNGLSYSKAKALEKTGYVKEPVYQKSFEASSGLYTWITVVFTNRIDSIYSDPVTWLEGWNEERAMSAVGKYCLLPSPFFEEEGLELGDQLRISERDAMSHLLEKGQPVPRNDEEALALLDTKRPKYTVIGRIETEDTGWSVIVPVTAFQTFSFFGTTLYFDSATYKLSSYYNVEEFREYVEELLLTAKEPPEFRMDTSDADHLYHNYRLMGTLFLISVVAALLLGVFLPTLIVLQSQKETAVLRALGWRKASVLFRFVLEQGFLCFLGIVIAWLVLAIVNGQTFFATQSLFLKYSVVHFIACVASITATSGLVLAKSPMALLQAKE